MPCCCHNACVGPIERLSTHNYNACVFYTQACVSRTQPQCLCVYTQACVSHTQPQCLCVYTQAFVSRTYVYDKSDALF